MDKIKIVVVALLFCFGQPRKPPSCSSIAVLRSWLLMQVLLYKLCFVHLLLHNNLSALGEWTSLCPLFPVRAAWAGLSPGGSSLFWWWRLGSLACLVLSWDGWESGRLSPWGSHVLLEAVPSLFTRWQEESQQREKTSAGTAALFQFLPVSYFLMLCRPQRATRPSHSHCWRRPARGSGCFCRRLCHGVEGPARHKNGGVVASSLPFPSRRSSRLGTVRGLAPLLAGPRGPPWHSFSVWPVPARRL